MFESVLQTRAVICGAGLLLAIIFFFAHLPLLLLIIPVAVLFLGIVADPEETHAVWYGMLNILGIFDLGALTDEERATCALKRHYFWFGEVGLAAVLAGSFAVPVGILLAGKAEITLAFIGAAVLFLPLFIFLPKFIRFAMNTGTDTVITMLGKNEQVKNVFWSAFAGLAGIIIAQGVDPLTALRIVEIITRTCV
ncbi:hypothetical protein [uncultured Methanoregula sp.]|uniref:hypothetical protein n=1 Tax=uncultured Methanoregula sp. TaxID=1005933 RepID=UPI002AAB644D|nr:hypothetical protein [uncultured Methanoregula sp.]